MTNETVPHNMINAATNEVTVLQFSPRAGLTAADVKANLRSASPTGS
jgi:hypothetical protein